MQCNIKVGSTVHFQYDPENVIHVVKEIIVSTPIPAEGEKFLDVWIICEDEFKDVWYHIDMVGN